MDRDEAIRHLRERLSDKKYMHSLGVAKTAEELARKACADSDKAYLAGLLHDITKELTYKEQIDFCTDNNITLDLTEQNEEKVLHQITGAFYIKNILNIKDIEIFNAIRYHTTGRENMSPVEKAVYLADCIEPGRTFDGVEKIREATGIDLDKGMITALYMSVYEVLGKKSLLHENTIKALNQYLLSMRIKGETYE